MRHDASRAPGHLQSHRSPQHGPRRTSRRSPARHTRLRPDRRHPERQHARISRKHPAPVCPHPQRHLSNLLRLPHRSRPHQQRHGASITGDNHMYYTIRHITRFRYNAPISESIMEVRIQPRSEGNQRCLDFRLHTSPRAHILTYRGEYGNRVHHFDIPNSHNALTISAEALVDITAPPSLPQTLTAQAWQELDAITANDDYWDSLMPSHFATPTPLLDELSAELNVQRRDD